jgi:zinc/manganese transport system substrate-binding protein
MMRHFARTLLAPLCAFAFVLWPARADDKLSVVTSFSILADLAHEVGGDQVTIKSLVGPDGDAHVFQPTPQDVRAVAQAQVVVVNGLGYEGWMDRLIRSSGFRGTQVTASAGIVVEPARGGRADPHAWQDPARVKQYVQNLAEGFAKADPAHAAGYRARAAAYIAQLTALENWIAAEISRVPVAQRRVIASHDAFNYLARRWGLQFIAPLGVNTANEATAKGVAALIRQMKTQNIRAVFVENIRDPRLMAQIARETGAKPAGRLYSDALSAPGGPAPSYLDLMRHNVRTLVAGMLLN